MLLMVIVVVSLFVSVTAFCPPLLPTVTQFQLRPLGEAVTVALAVGTAIAQTAMQIADIAKELRIKQPQGKKDRQ